MNVMNVHLNVPGLQTEHFGDRKACDDDDDEMSRRSPAFVRVFVRLT